MRIFYAFLLLSLVAFSGCAWTNTPESDAIMMDDEMNMEQMEDHLGCSEDEITDGTCEVAAPDQNNADLFSQTGEFTVSSSDVEYTDGVTGYLAEPQGLGISPGVIMIHEWWGLNDNIKQMADLLASEGYTVLAVDLYEGQVAEESELAGELAGSVRSNPDNAVLNMRAAKEFLADLPNVDSKKLVSMGWCFGGQQSLNLALASNDLAATVIYYGNLVTDQRELGTIDWPVLGIFGEEDQGIPVSVVNTFESSLDDLGIENEIYIYPGVGHAFANPSGSRYAEEETLDAWEKTVNFLEENVRSD